MSLNIKNPEAHKLAQKLAELTGESMAQAVVEAIKERLSRIETEQGREARSKRILELVADMQARMPDWFKSADLDKMLYDEMGLPK